MDWTSFPRSWPKLVVVLFYFERKQLTVWTMTGAQSGIHGNQGCQQTAEETLFAFLGGSTNYGIYSAVLMWDLDLNTPCIKELNT